MLKPISLSSINMYGKQFFKHLAKRLNYVFLHVGSLISYLQIVTEHYVSLHSATLNKV